MSQTREAVNDRGNSQFDRSQSSDSSEILRASVTNQDMTEYQKAQLAQFAKENFSQLDEDKDGFIEFREIDILSNRSTADDDPKWYEMLDLLKENYDEMQNASWDKWIREGGVSPKDLDAYSKSSRRQT